MTPMNLKSGPPRPPRETAGGIVFLPRSIDKLRASLPGGDRGLYNITGLTTRMMEQLGLEEDELLAAVRDAKTDDDVVAFVKARTTQEKIDAWNTFVLNRIPLDGDRAKLVQNYTWLGEMPGHSLLAVDLLVEDDRRTFAE